MRNKTRIVKSILQVVTILEIKNDDCRGGKAREMVLFCHKKNDATKSKVNVIFVSIDNSARFWLWSAA